MVEMIRKQPARSALELIGNTPMIELTRLGTGTCRLFAKLENQNPGGSIKDRIGLAMIEAAERDGAIAPGATIIEATAGNTGLGLALAGVLKGYHVLLVVPDKMAREKIQHLRALGAEVRITRSDVGKGHPDHYQDKAERLARETGGFYVNQFANPANPKAHEETTGPEIWEQMDHDLQAIVMGVGSGGTLTGIGRFLRSVSPDVQIILADPQGSILAPYVWTGEIVQAGSWAAEGIGDDFIPPNADMSLINRAYSISDKEAVEAARALLSKEGILGGSSSGTLIAAALKYCREQTEPRRVVTLVPDSGNKYLSKIYNDYWVLEQGLADRELHGDLRDLIARRFDRGGMVTVSPSETLLIAYNRMRDADVSQLPVVDDERVVGILDESDILAFVEGAEEGRAERFRERVDRAMTRELHTMQSTDRLDSLRRLFERNEVAIVLEKDKFAGLITRVDLLNHLRHSR
jgi:cystathionine beta-synthase